MGTTTYRREGHTVALDGGGGAGHRTPAVPEAPAPDFAQLADPFRAELLAHCYRMLGSVQDAEDQVQETYLRAWRSYGDFEGRSSLRTWLYRIATNACLTALDGRRRQPVPSGFPESEHDTAEPSWPVPVGPVEPGAHDLSDPAAVLTSREHRLRALTVAWRHLAPRQRAVLVLRDVFEWHATEIADLLGTSGAAVHSMVRRTRTHLAQLDVDPDSAEPDDAGTDDAAARRVLEGYVTAFETGDVGLLVDLLTEDAVCLQASGTTVTGREQILRLIARCPALGECRLVAITVHERPGFGIYRRAADGQYRAYTIDVLAASRSGISRLEVIEDRSFFATFGLPHVHPAGPDPAAT
jgi:RNA polymerase sigma-70 factor (ECF subfamily)